MSLTFIRHTQLQVPIVALAALIFMLMSSQGISKSASEFSALDFIAEGGAVVMCLCWFFWLARSRPGGRVTTLLLLGIGGIFLSLWADLLDEFFKLPATVLWDKWLESVPMPIGLLILTVGIYCLHQEQIVLAKHMKKRERLFREHRHFDALTPLADASYLRQQLENEIVRAEESKHAAMTLVAIDLTGFALINHRYGYAEGDHILQTLSQLLLLNLRPQDLLCRLAGDRFVALLPDTSMAQAAPIASDLQSSVDHFAFRTQKDQHRLMISISTLIITPKKGETTESILTRLSSPIVSTPNPRLAYV